MPKLDDKELEIVPYEVSVQVSMPFQRSGSGEGNSEDYALEELSIERALKLNRNGIISSVGKGFYASPDEASQVVKLTDLLRMFVEEANNHGVIGLPKSDTLEIRSESDTDTLATIDGALVTGETGIGMLTLNALLLKLPMFTAASVEGQIDEEGLIYYDTTSNTIRWRNDSAWASLT